MHLIGLALLSIALTADAGSADDSSADTGDVFVRRLLEAGVDPTPAGLAAYFDGIAPSEAKRRRVDELIRALGSPDYEERVRAMAALPRIHPPPIDSLQKAARAVDGERGRRAARVLAGLDEAAHRQTLLAAMRTVVRKRIRGLAGAVAAVEVPSGWRDLDKAAVAAFAATANEADLPLARRLVQDGDRLHQRMGLAALSELEGLAGLAEFKPLLGHDDPEIRLAVATGLASAGSREGLPTLVAVLDAEDPAVREDAAEALRRLTGRRFGFAGYGTAEHRREAAEKWKQWVALHGDTAPLAPYQRDGEPIVLNEHGEVGRTLVCIWEEQRLAEFDADWKWVWSVGSKDSGVLKYAWGCWGTPEGHRIVCDAPTDADREPSSVIEYDAAGNECWRVGNLPGRPTGVQRLENGNTLIALSDGDQVIEVDRAGKTVWRFAITGRPTTAQRLRDGRTVINLQNAGRVVAVDPDGNTTTLLGGLDRPHTAQMLENGNILVCEMDLQRVDEFDQEGRLVWRKDGLQNPAQAQRLSNGNTLISDNVGIHEFDPDGELVSQLVLRDPKDPSKNGRSRFHRY